MRDNMDASDGRTLRDCQADAVVLLGMLRGMIALCDDSSPDAQEGLQAVLYAARNKAAGLADELDRHA